MKKIFTLLLCSALFVGSCWGGDIQIGELTSESSQYLPIGATSTSYNSITQMLYLASELTAAGAKAGNIEGISFYYTGSTEKIRTIEVRMNAVTKTNLATSSGSGKWFYYISSTIKNPGPEYYSGKDTLKNDGGWHKIRFSTPFAWNGTSDVVITINDKSNDRISNGNRYHKTYTATAYRALYVNKGSGTAYNASDTYSISGTATTTIPVIKFSFAGSTPTPTYDAPTKVNVFDISSSSAKINWTKNDSAKVKLQYVKHGQTDTTTINNIDANFYVINSLAAEAQYDYKVYAVYPTGISSAVTGSFTTTEASSHSHDGVDFIMWDATNSLPTSAGNYFLKDNVSVSSWTVPSGDTKICLNGNTITISSGYITVGSGKSLSIYDNEGNGAISVEQAFFPTIKVNGGTLSLYGGSINNTASTSSSAYAIDVTSGTFNIKGDVKMSTGTSAANVYLRNTSSVITLAGAITNTTKLSISKAANQNITSGWSTQMGSADPADYFSSKNIDAPAVVLVDGEAQLGVPSITISETGVNTIENNKLADVKLVRTFQAGILNTIALPFALDNDQMKETFGNDFELYELSSSSLDDNVLSLQFGKVTSLSSGAPYLLRISSEVKNPSFSSVTLKTATQSKTTTAVTMRPVISEQEVKGNENNMYLNAAGELNWSTVTGPFKGMRAYFHLNSGSPSNISARRIVLDTNSTTGLMQNAECTMQNDKVMINGQLFIIKNGVKYNAQGQIVK